MAKIIVHDVKELVERLEKADFEICEHIYKAIAQGMQEGKKVVRVFTVVIEGHPEEEFDFSLEKVDWKTALNTCLDEYTTLELFGECVNIKELLDKLK